MSYRLVGLGTSITDFDSLIANVPQAASAWQTVQHQFDAEGGAAPGIIPIAQKNFYESFDQLTSTLKVLPNSPEGLASAGLAAAGLTINSSTIGGAIQNVEGLIGAVESGVPGPIVQSFTGVLVSGLGLAVAAGACSFGVGAAITIGLEIIGAVVADLFGSGQQPSASICGVDFTGGAPKYVVGCAWSFGQPVPAGPHSQFWRKFPQKNNSADAWWFQVCGNPNYDPNASIGSPGRCDGMPSTTWTSGSSSDTWGASTGSIVPSRPIDAAFPKFHQLECDLAAVAVADSLPDSGGSVTLPGLGTFTFSAEAVGFARFVKAYYGAWTANQEYALNGLKPQDDVLVLKQLLQFWNAAHSSSATYTISPPSNTSGLNDFISASTACSYDFAHGYYYLQMMVGDLRHTDTSVLDGNGNLIINVGPKKTAPVPKMIRLHNLAPALNTGAGLNAGASAPMSTTGKVLLGTTIAVGLGALALEAYARMHHMTFGQSAKHVWTDVSSKFHRTPRMRPRTRHR